MQTTNLDIRELVFDRFTLLFGAPEAGRAHALAEEYARVLRRFPRQTLKRAVDCLAESHKYRRWPSVAETVSACRDARPRRDTVPSAGAADRRQLVADTLRSKPGRAPNAAQYQQMAAASARARQMADKELAAGTGATQRLKAMWRAMSAREDALRREFLA